MRPGRPKVTWKSVQNDPEYRAIWELLKDGPKTFKQLREALNNAPPDPARSAGIRVLPGTLFKRLKKMDRAGLVRYERDQRVLKAWEGGGLFKPDPPTSHGRPASGAWAGDPGDSAAIQVALAHADILERTPKENLTLERIGNGAELLVAGTREDSARWWYPAQFQGSTGMLFEVLDRVSRELGRVLLCADAGAVRAQGKLRKVVSRYRHASDRLNRPPVTEPHIKSAIEVSDKHTILLTISIRPSRWWGDDGLPVELVPKAAVALARIHDMTKPPSMPISVADTARSASAPLLNPKGEQGVSILAAQASARTTSKAATRKPRQEARRKPVS